MENVSLILSIIVSIISIVSILIQFKKPVSTQTKSTYNNEKIINNQGNIQNSMVDNSINISNTLSVHIDNKKNAITRIIFFCL